MARHGKASKGGWIDHGAEHRAGGRRDRRRHRQEVSGEHLQQERRVAQVHARQDHEPADGAPERGARIPTTSRRYDAFDRWHALATSANVYRRQPDCDAITIGKRIYHEAYARQWVSYLAAARAKGLTGYQFRAPGEWFAELYAGWKTKKLGRPSTRPSTG